MDNLGSRKARLWGTENMPPNIISLESHTVNAGDPMKDAKEGGK